MTLFPSPLASQYTATRSPFDITIRSDVAKELDRLIEVNKDTPFRKVITSGLERCLELWKLHLKYLKRILFGSPDKRDWRFVDLTMKGIRCLKP